MTPLEKMLTELGPIRTDGSDKFFGMENVSVYLSPFFSGPLLITALSVRKHMVSGYFARHSQTTNH